MIGEDQVGCDARARIIYQHKRQVRMLPESTLQKVMTEAVLRFGTHHSPRSFAWSGNGKGI